MADLFIITDYVKDALVDSDVVKLIAETIKTRIEEEEDYEETFRSLSRRP